MIFNAYLVITTDICSHLKQSEWYKAEETILEKHHRSIVHAWFCEAAPASAKRGWTPRAYISPMVSEKTFVRA